jgi:hypothetical protein
VKSVLAPPVIVTVTPSLMEMLRSSGVEIVDGPATVSV